MKVTTTLYAAGEALTVLNNYAETRLPGGIGIKIFDNSDLLMKKVEFMTRETQKITHAYGTKPEDPANPASRLVVFKEDGTIDDEQTQKFTDEVITLRLTEIELDIEPFTMDEIKQHLPISAVEYSKIKFMVTKDPEPEIIDLGEIALGG